MGIYSVPVVTVMGAVMILLPMGLLIAAAIQMLRTRLGTPAVLIAIGGVLLALKSLDFILYIVTAHHGAEQVAAYAITAAYVGRIIEFAALLLIAIGMLQVASRLKSPSEKADGL